jgi:hypothetical protein
MGGSETGWIGALWCRPYKGARSGMDISVGIVVVVCREGMMTFASGNPRRARIAPAFCSRSAPWLPSAFRAALTTEVRSDGRSGRAASTESWRVWVATGASNSEPHRAPILGTVTDAVKSLAFRSSGLGSDMPSFQTTLPGPLIQRLRRGVAATNAAAASVDVHEHQRHNGIYTFEKPHCRQVNRGRFAGANSNCGNEVDFGRCYTYHREVLAMGERGDIKGNKNFTGL